jgi:hypothetical protein
MAMLPQRLQLLALLLLLPLLWLVSISKVWPASGQ